MRLFLVFKILIILCVSRFVFGQEEFIIFEYSKENKSVLHLFYEQKEILESLINEIVREYKEEFIYESKSDVDIDYISAIKNQYLMEKFLKPEFLSLKFSYRENSSLVSDDNNYPYKRNISFGLNLNILKNGFFADIKRRNLANMKYEMYMLDIIKLYPLKESILISTNLIAIEEENRNFIKTLQRSYLDKLVNYSENISRYDKYYQNIVNISKNYLNTLKIGHPNEKFRLYNFCILDGNKIDTMLESKKKNVISYLDKFDIKQLSFIDILAESNLKFMVDYNYRKLANNQTGFGSFGVDLEIPLTSNANIYHNLDKLKLVEEKRKILYQFYMYEKEIKDEIDNQYQNYYNFQTHLIILTQIMNEIDKELKSVELGIKDMNIYEINSLINRAYNEVQLLNIYYFKILHSYKKVKLLLNVLEIEENFCRAD